MTNMKVPVLWMVLILCGYLSGSIMFSRKIPIIFGMQDIVENSDDHNPGSSNVFKLCGVKIGIICLVLDIFKGFAPVFLSYLFVNVREMPFALAMLAPVLGHATAPFDSFKGGKCIATSFGVMIALLPISRIGFILAFLYIFFSVVIKIKLHKARSIVTYSVFAVISALLLTYRSFISIAAGCVLISAVVIIKHTKLFSNGREKEKTEKNA